MGIGGLIEAGAAGAALLKKKGNYDAAGSDPAISPPLSYLSLIHIFTLEHLRSDNRIFISALDQWGAAFGCISSVRNHLLGLTESWEADG